ncbi:MAG: hypothetical protein QOI92_1583 [Chloroflexota bacterium]|nr:hypothetical protein [Chloroflexota bacterium]
MRPTMLSLIAGAAIVLAACSSASPTQAPVQTADAGGGGGGATQAPAATAGGGGLGGGGATGTGTVHLEVSGPVSKTGDYDFAPAGSIFGGSQGSSLNFTNDQTNEVVSILVSADGQVLVSYGSLDFSVPASVCTTTNWNLTATGGSGEFDCNASLVITAAGAQLTGGRIKGSFTAHA